MTDKDMLGGSEYGDTTDEDEFSNIFADLVSLAANEPFLKRLFASPASQWVALDVACAGLGDIQRRIDGFQQRSETQLFAVWLAPPMEGGDAADYCLILFFDQSRHWISTATYYGPLFQDRQA